MVKSFFENDLQPQLLISQLQKVGSHFASSAETLTATLDSLEHKSTANEFVYDSEQRHA